MPKPDVSDYASHWSAYNDGEAYSETVRFDNNDYTITMEDPNIRFLSDEMLEALSGHVMNLNKFVAYQFTQHSGLNANATLVDITAVKIKDADEYFKAYQCAAILNPHEGIVAVSVPNVLRLALTRKIGGFNEPYYERTLEWEGEIPGWDDPDPDATFFDNALLTPYYASLLQVASLAFDEVLPSTPLPLSIAQIKRHINNSQAPFHLNIRFSVMFDEDYCFKDGRKITSRGGYVNVFVDGMIIEKLVRSGERKLPDEMVEKGIELQRMIALYPRRPIQQEMAMSSPYVVLLLMMLFDDDTTTRMVSRLTLNKRLKFALKLLSMNDDEDAFVIFDEERAFDTNIVVVLKEALRLYGLKPELQEAIRYEQVVRVANIALKINR